MNLKHKVEALLFSSGKAMEEEQLAALTETEQKDVKKALKQLQKDYEARETSLKVFNEGHSWKLLVKDKHISLVRRIVVDTELSKATLETLAVIAYNQPKVLQSKVVELRGGNAYEHITELVELGFVTKEKSGRSFSLRLTEKFFDYFDVEGADSIRKVFKGVKVPTPKERQKQLDGLAVVDIPAKEERTLDPPDKLKIVDVAEEDAAPQGFAAGTTTEDAPAQLVETDEEKVEKSDFLSKIEEQINTLSSRNDDRDEDSDFKSSASEESEENPEGTDAPEEVAEEAGEEPAEESRETEGIPAEERETAEESDESDGSKKE